MASLVASHPADVVRVLTDKIAVEVQQFLPHLGRVFLVDAEYDRLCETVCALEEIGQVPSNRPGARAQCHDTLEILRLVLLVRHLAAKAVEFVL
jgi:hypothetical protein